MKEEKELFNNNNNNNERHKHHSVTILDSVVRVQLSMDDIGKTRIDRYNGGQWGECGGSLDVSSLTNVHLNQHGRSIVD